MLVLFFGFVFALFLLLFLFLLYSTARCKGIGTRANADLRGQNVLPYTPKLVFPHDSTFDVTVPGLV